MAHTDYGTDTQIRKPVGANGIRPYRSGGVGEWLTRIMARMHG
ncbi:hypothetical protein [Okeania sp. SIO3B5]|nr:hypothetical protein [Okeania sp. SIO3B5]